MVGHLRLFRCYSMRWGAIQRLAAEPTSLSARKENPILSEAPMLRFAPFVILLAAFPAGAPRQAPSAATASRDTVQAGDPVVDASRLRPFSIERRLTLARGDSIIPFGRQSEQLTSGTLDGRPVYLDVLTFETPRGTTVDSSWIEAATLRPLRMHSSNKARVVTLEFDGRTVRGRTVPAEGDPTNV